VCNKSGLLPGLYCPPENIITEIAAKGKQPNSLCNYHRETVPEGGSGSN